MATHPDVTFHLLPYRMLAQRWRTLSFLLIPAGGALYWVVPQWLPHQAHLAPLSWGISFAGLLLFLYTLLAARSRVTCERDHFTVRTPLYPVAFSYRRISVVRPVEFGSLYPLEKAKAAHQRIYYGLWGKTVPTITLKDYPLPLWWLRLWFHPYLFNPQEIGLVLPIDDWMAFTRHLDTLRTTKP